MNPEQKRGCVLLLSPLCAFAAGFGVALWRIHHPETPEWWMWVAGAIGLLLPLRLLPRTEPRESVPYALFKLVCHVACLPLGFVPVLAGVWLLSLAGVDPRGKLGDTLGKIGAAVGIATALSLSYYIERRFFTRPQTPTQPPREQ
jgi:hypothetical protein